MFERGWCRWALGLAFWAILACFFASQTVVSSAYRGHPSTWHQALIFPAIDCSLWAMFTPFVLWGARRFPFEKGNWAKALVFHFVMAIAVAFAELRLFSMIVPFAYGSTAGGRVSSIVVFRNLVPGNLHTAVLTYALIVAAAHGLAFYQGFRDRELRATQLEAKLAQAQLQVLRMQLQPHFLFNTLHSISALVHEDPDGADRMLAQLGDLLRMTLSPEATQEVALRQELDFLDRYLEIEKTRLGDRLHICRAVAPETLDARVPHLILQPLLENAIRYAVAPRSQGGKVEIRATRRDGLLRIEVWDDGPGLKSLEGSMNGTGLGLKNTRERLSQLYGSAATLELSNVPTKGFLAALTLPLQLDTSSQKHTGVQ
jgi:two-component system, LytTR family, sensor kinase